MRDNTKVDGSQVADGLGGLIQTMVVPFPAKDPNTKETKQDQIVDPGSINPMQPLPTPDHVGPEPVIMVEMRECLRPPPRLVNGLVPCMDHILKAILGNLKLRP